MMCNLTKVTCANCGLEFHFPQSFDDRRRYDGQDFYCPNGHPNVYDGKAEKERRELQRLRQRMAERDDVERHLRERAEQAERSAAAQKGQVTRLRNRAKAGVCPCCNRSFQNLRRHMENKHPDAAPDLEVIDGGKVA